MEVPLEDKKPILHSVPGNGAPKSPAGNLTPEVVRYLAREEARKEIVATAGALAKKVQDVMAQSMGPLNARIDMLLAEQHRTAVVVNALVEMIVEKQIATKKEIEDKIVSIHEREVARQVEISKKKAEVATGKVAVLPPAAEPSKEN